MLRPLALAATLLLAACGGPPPDPTARLDALTQRLERIEQRLAALEGLAPAIDALRSGTADVDRRLAGIEGRLRALGQSPADDVPAAERGAAPGPTAGPGARRRARAQDLRPEMQALNREFRARREAVRARYGDAPSPERRAAMLEVLRWYRTERRALLGTGPTAPPAS